MKYIITTFILCFNVLLIGQTVTCTASITNQPTRTENPDLDPEGPYFPGEEVNFCVQIKFIVSPIGEGNNCQWIQGVIPVLGPGWDKTISDLENQAPIQGFWLEEDMVDYNNENPTLSISTNCLGEKVLIYDVGNMNPGDLLPAGWWYVSPGGSGCENDGDPDNGWGLPESCGADTLVIDFCFDLTVKSLEEIINGGDCLLDLSVDIFTFADGETGCWTNASCGHDPPLLFKATVDTSHEVQGVNNLGQHILSINPNPVSDVINITSNLPFKFGYSIMDSMGNSLENGFVESNSYMPFSQFPSGIYFIKIYDILSKEYIIEKVLKL